MFETHKYIILFINGSKRRYVQFLSFYAVFRKNSGVGTPPPRLGNPGFVTAIIWQILSQKLHENEKRSQ